jgi:glycosyltransferase involved in cell wall biosynthesis
MRVVHVIPSVAEEASGPSYSVVRLCESLLDTGVDVRMASLEPGTETPRPRFLKTFPIGIGPKRLGTSPAMSRWLSQAVAEGGAEIVHNHSLWMMPNVYAGQATRGGRSRLVVSPRGTLSARALRVNSFQKEVFWRLVQGPAVRTAACFHATADAEYQDIRRRGFNQPVCVLPNGIDVPPHVAVEKPARRTLLFLGRIDPIKGLDHLLRAWHAVEPQFSDWDLVIAGPDSRGHRAAMESLRQKLRLSRVSFLGPLYGGAKLAAYRRASISVLPTNSENFGMTVAESLAAGTPVIVTKGAPWPGLTTADAGWWIDIGVDSLVACLEEALALPPERLQDMGQNGREWMSREFSWESIGRQLFDVYRWLLCGGDVPPCVKVA